jgi:hypothetical protein
VAVGFPEIDSLEKGLAVLENGFGPNENGEMPVDGCCPEMAPIWTAAKGDVAEESPEGCAANEGRMEKAF